MKIAYIVLTCKLYENTRKIWQKETSLKNVDDYDIFYLSYKMNPSKRLFSWGAHDGYNGLPFKMIDFFRYMYLDNYDWIVIIDDDTYLYVNRLKNLLEEYSSSDYVVIGKLLTHLDNTEWGKYFSGGAGTIISNATYNLLYKHIANTHHYSYLARHWCADICLGTWLHLFPFIKCIDNNHFHIDMNGDPKTALSFHHLKIESDWKTFYINE